MSTEATLQEVCSNRRDGFFARVASPGAGARSEGAGAGTSGAARQGDDSDIEGGPRQCSPASHSRTWEWTTRHTRQVWLQMVHSLVQVTRRVLTWSGCQQGRSGGWRLLRPWPWSQQDARRRGRHSPCRHDLRLQHSELCLEAGVAALRWPKRLSLAGLGKVEAQAANCRD